MSPTARLISIDAVSALAVALRRFEEEATVALADLDLEVNRGVQCVADDRLYWSEQVKRGWENLTAARLDLERARGRAFADHEPSCYDEKKALEKAKRRLHTAEEKVDASKRWRYVVDREVIEYQGGVNQLASWLQVDLPRAVALLRRMSQALEAYVARVEGGEPPQAVDWSAMMSAAAAPAASEAGDQAEERPAEKTSAPPSDEAAKSGRERRA